jgi:hypothetical protein
MAPTAVAAAPTAADLPIEGKTVKAVTLLSLKRTHDLFVGNHGHKVPVDEEAQRVKVACKVRAAFSWVTVHHRWAAWATIGSAPRCTCVLLQASSVNFDSHCCNLILLLPYRCETSSAHCKASSRGKPLQPGAALQQLQLLTSLQQTASRQHPN